MKSRGSQPTILGQLRTNSVYCQLSFTLQNEISPTSNSMSQTVPIVEQILSYVYSKGRFHARCPWAYLSSRRARSRYFGQAVPVNRLEAKGISVKENHSESGRYR